MFNQAAFNQTAYNRPSGGPIVIAIQLSSSSTASIRLICAVPLTAHLDGISSSTQNLITAVSAVLSAVSSLTHKDSARAHIASTGSMTASCWLVMYNAANLSAGSEFSPQVVHIIPISYVSDGLSDTNFDLVHVRMQNAVLGSVGDTNFDLVHVYVQNAMLGSLSDTNFDLTRVYIQNAVLSSIGDANFDLERAHMQNVILSSSSDTNFDLTRVYMQNAALSSLSDTNFDLVRAYIQNAVLGSLSELRVLGEVTPWLALRFSGSVNPNDVVEIDTERMTVTINGQNALHLVGGRFWELVAGRNIIKYTDSETSRQVALTITFRDRWL